MILVTKKWERHDGALTWDTNMADSNSECRFELKTSDFAVPLQQYLGKHLI